MDSGMPGTPAPEAPKKRGRPKNPPAPASSPAAITCPACKSKVSADGKTLHEKSGYLEELIATDAGVDEIEKNMAEQLKLVNADKAELNNKIAELETQLAAAKKPIEKKETRTDGPVQQNQKRGSHWD